MRFIVCVLGGVKTACYNFLGKRLQDLYELQDPICPPQDAKHGGERLKVLGKIPSTPAIADGGVLAAIKIRCTCSARCQARRWSVLAANHNCVHVHRGDGNDGGIEHCVYVLGKMPSTAIVASSPPIIIVI